MLVCFMKCLYILVCLWLVILFRFMIKREKTAKDIQENRVVKAMRWLCNLLYAVSFLHLAHELFYLLACELDIVLVAEILYCASDFSTSV